MEEATAESYGPGSPGSIRISLNKKTGALRGRQPVPDEPESMRNIDGIVQNTFSCGAPCSDALLGAAMQRLLSLVTGEPATSNSPDR
jgi:hypothetical protein